MAETADHQKSTRRRKIQAILAGGTVLGIGAAVTLANWNDSVFAEGFFQSGAFNVEGSLDGDSYSEHDAAENAAQLAFDAGALNPGGTVSAPLWIRADAATTVAGVIGSGGITVDADGGNTEALSYSIYALDADATCSDSPDGTPVATGSTLDSSPDLTSDLTLNTGSGEAAGTAVQLCFVVDAAEEGFAQATETSAVWTVTATSVED